MGNICWNRRSRLTQCPFGIVRLFERYVVEEPRGKRQQHRDLLGHRHRLGFRLLETRANAPPMLDGLSGRFIQARAKLGECLQFFELRIGELEISRDGAIRRALRRPPNA